MKIVDMEIGIPYITLEDSVCGTIRKNDNIRIDSDGNLINAEANGWLEMDDWKNDKNIINVPVSINTKNIDHQIDMYENILDKLKKVKQTSNNF